MPTPELTEVDQLPELTPFHVAPAVAAGPSVLVAGDFSQTGVSEQDKQISSLQSESEERDRKLAELKANIGKVLADRAAAASKGASSAKKLDSLEAQMNELSLSLGKLRVHMQKADVTKAPELDMAAVLLRNAEDQRRLATDAMNEDEDALLNDQLQHANKELRKLRLAVEAAAYAEAQQKAQTEAKLQTAKKMEQLAANLRRDAAEQAAEDEMLAKKLVGVTDSYTNVKSRNAEVVSELAEQLNVRQKRINQVQEAINKLKAQIVQSEQQRKESEVAGARLAEHWSQLPVAQRALIEDLSNTLDKETAFAVKAKLVQQATLDELKLNWMQVLFRMFFARILLNCFSSPHVLFGRPRLSVIVMPSTTSPLSRLALMLSASWMRPLLRSLWPKTSCVCASKQCQS
jgi:chromosome segregation ATPase